MKSASALGLPMRRRGLPTLSDLPSINAASEKSIRATTPATSLRAITSNARRFSTRSVGSASDVATTILASWKPTTRTMTRLLIVSDSAGIADYWSTTPRTPTKRGRNCNRFAGTAIGSSARGARFPRRHDGGRTPKAGGRLLDGREWNEFPVVAS